MRRLLMLTIAPLSIACLLGVGCKSSGDNGSMTWNEGNPWGERHASQTGATMEPGTAKSAPPATQPSSTSNT